MRKLYLLAIVGPALSSAFACSSADKTSAFDPSQSGDGGGNPYADAGQVFGGDSGVIGFGDGATAPPSGCSDAAKLIYVVDDANGLHSFYPPTLTFKDIGTLNCPAGGAQPNSMGVDRSAVAWVNYNDGTLYKVSTKDASCQKTTFVAGQHGWGRFGMGFASNSPGSTDETLFVAGIDHHQLGSIDLGTMALTLIGKFDGALSTFDAELTGTGDAKLYGFFTNKPSSIAELNKTSASILSNKPQSGVSTGTDWAFSFWGGDFFMYTADMSANPLATSDVTRYRPSDGSTTVVKQSIGYRIVGAGVSTCAPTTPPR